ncbi:MAG: hypothetical protein R3Y07_02555 [Eubacteriales bacterium]
MELTINEKEKYVIFWLTQSEHSDDQLKASLKPRKQFYLDKKFKIFMMLSGKRDLYDSTLHLLQQNLRSNKTPTA